MEKGILTERTGSIDRLPKPHKVADRTEIEQRGRTYDRRKEDKKRA